MSQVTDQLNAVFEAAHPELKKEFLGQYVVVKGIEIVVGFPTFIEAMLEAVERWGPNGEYIVRRVEEEPKNAMLEEMIRSCPCCNGEAPSDTVTTTDLGGGFKLLSIPFAPSRLPRAERRRLEREARRAARRSFQKS